MARINLEAKKKPLIRRKLKVEEPEFPNVTWTSEKLWEVLKEVPEWKTKPSYYDARNIATYQGNSLPNFTMTPQPSCCGMTIIAGFADNTWNPTYPDYNCNTKSWDLRVVAAWLCLNLRQCAPYTIATTNTLQPNVAFLLEKIGYKVINQFVNPNSDREVKVWMARSRP